jgi:F-type H+-transporting ATPase subunit alpha
VISITDGQIYTNRLLFLDGIRPAVDSALSVSRIGSSAQCKLMKLLSSGLKNEVTNLMIIRSLAL